MLLKSSPSCHRTQRASHLPMHWAAFYLFSMATRIKQPKPFTLICKEAEQTEVAGCWTHILNLWTMPVGLGTEEPCHPQCIGVYDPSDKARMQLAFQIHGFLTGDFNQLQTTRIKNKTKLLSVLNMHRLLLVSIS